MRPKSRPDRLNINVSPKTYAMICEVAELMNEPRSKVASQLLDELQPALEAQLEYLREAQAAIQAGKLKEAATRERLIADLENQSKGLQTEVKRTLQCVMKSIKDFSGM